ncbi:HAD family hydrolase [Photobacterium aquae]|uniref:HAD family hydrolase n=1 Tax=Photobacterium aquae TaxID=1195763 RepID=A0A0J1H053_9GAMM|nr:HAD family phosphatase [Photobacterium aquae]KLV05200.1 HAD family hydrolase [Photobacterium aquae]
MDICKIKHVVFDVGNVIVRWSPIEIVRLTFGEQPQDEAEQLASCIFQSDIWLELNKGLLSAQQAKIRYEQELGLSARDCEQLFYYIMHTQLLIFGTVDLIKRLKSAGYRVYALTDNVVEIVEHLKSTYDFWPLFDGAVVSADLGLLKPQLEIYQSLLSCYQLDGDESVFIDDMARNVEGAKLAGMSAIQFENAAQCEQALRFLGLSFPAHSDES